MSARDLPVHQRIMLAFVTPLAIALGALLWLIDRLSPAQPQEPSDV